MFPSGKVTPKQEISESLSVDAIEGGRENGSEGPIATGVPQTGAGKKELPKYLILELSPTIL